MTDNDDNALCVWKLVLKDKNANGRSVTEKATNYLFANLKSSLKCRTKQCVCMHASSGTHTQNDGNIISYKLLWEFEDLYKSKLQKD
jgi:hypothetical protein